MTSENDKTDPSGYVEHQVEHFKQQYNWDCGVSCVLMLLSSEQRENALQNFSKICQEEGFGQSTWTIDLCYLLKRFGIKHCMYTAMPGVNESYHKHGYYNKIINLDRERVQCRFKEASAAGVVVVPRPVTTEELLEHLTKHGPAVMLVDAGLLVCDLCKHNKLKSEFRRCFGGGYSGHYVLVVGLAARARRLLYRDPARAPRLCAASAARLRRASSAAGTDQDSILIYNNFR